MTDPIKGASTKEPTTTTTATASPAVTEDTLQTLYDVFNSIPRDHIKDVYVRLKNESNPNWYDDIVNELLSYDTLQTSTSKRSFDDMNVNDDDFIPDEYNRLLAILPDIDPDYALESYMKFAESSSDKPDLNTLITSLIEHGYVKLTEKLERIRNERLKENLRHPKFEIEEFLKTFSNPLEYFYDLTKNVSEAYKKHSYIYLANAFARISSEHIKEVLEMNNYRFAPSMRQLREEFFAYNMNSTQRRNRSRDCK